MNSETNKKPITDYVSTVIPFLENILYSIALCRVINSRFANENSGYDPFQREFWTHIYNNSIQMVIIDWCKVFGSPNNNPFHYSMKADVELDDYEETKSRMVRFRNKFIAHKTEVGVPVPFLQEAEKVMYNFDEKIREVYELDGLPSLKDRYNCYQSDIKQIMEQYKITEI